MRNEQLEAGIWTQELFNVFVEKPWEEYNVDTRYYIEQVRKEINNLMPDYNTGQMSLF